MVSIPDRTKALAGVSLYVGDGASVTRPILRRRGGRLIGHASIRDQLGWCAEAGVTRALFTHCGSEIVRRGEEEAAAKVEAMARERGIEAAIAYDGLEIGVRGAARVEVQ